MKILQVASEYYGLIKTGGLADMVASLSASLAQQGNDVRVCLPAYRGLPQKLESVRDCGGMRSHGQEFRIIRGRLPGSNLDVLLLDCPVLFDRPGDPYRDDKGREFEDNGWRFACFNRVLVELVREGVEGWKPDLVHLHDWHLGLAAALLAHQTAPTATVFTIHNLAFQGVFSRNLFDALELPAEWWHPEELEFYGRFSFMKAALNYADRITVVSPRYAEEIRTPEFGCGLEGVIAKNWQRITGITNGLDSYEWNPTTDPHLVRPYSAGSLLSGKRANKVALQAELGLAVSDKPLVIFIGRLADQKGADLILAAREKLDRLPVQIAILGRGDPELEIAFRTWAQDVPDRVAAVIDVDEVLAHRLTAAADLQLMPSRFEPCGLSQMYAQNYGTLPVARATGGLADTIVDATDKAVADGTATGFLFERAETSELVTALRRALNLIGNKRLAGRMRRAAMERDFSWQQSARAYQQVYQQLRPDLALSRTDSVDHRGSGSASAVISHRHNRQEAHPGNNKEVPRRRIVREPE